MYTSDERCKRWRQLEDKVSYGRNIKKKNVLRTIVGFQRSKGGLPGNGDADVGVGFCRARLDQGLRVGDGWLGVLVSMPMLVKYTVRARSAHVRCLVDLDVIRNHPKTEMITAPHPRKTNHVDTGIRARTRPYEWIYNRACLPSAKAYRGTRS